MYRFLTILIASLCLTGGAVAEPDAKGFMGMSVYTFTPSMAEALGVPGQTGAFVDGVAIGGSAQKAGFRRNDVVLSIDGQDVSDSADVVDYTSGQTVGSTMQVRILRQGEDMTIPVRLLARPENVEKLGVIENSMALASMTGSTGSGTFLGMQLRPLTPEETETFDLYSHSIGFYIEDCAQFSSAWLQGVRADMVLLEVNLEPAKTFDLLTWHSANARASGRNKILLGIANNERTTNVVVTLPAEPADPE